MSAHVEQTIHLRQAIDANISTVKLILNTNDRSISMQCLGDNMKMFVAIANKIYEIDRLGNSRFLYVGRENMTISAVDYHYRNRILYFTDSRANQVNKLRAKTYKNNVVIIYLYPLDLLFITIITISQRNTHS